MSADLWLAAPTLVCGTCGAEMEWDECETCGGDGSGGHDCGEDTCCCLYPVDNVPCSICAGEGGWWSCPDSKQHPDAEVAE